MKIIDYQIVVGNNNRALSVAVIDELEEGWQPYGYPYVVNNGIERQAMVKYEATKPAKKVKAND